MGRKKKVDLDSLTNSSVKSEDIEKEVKINSLIDDFKSENAENEAKNEKKPRKKKEQEIEKENFTNVASINASLFLEILVARMPKPQPLSDSERESFDKAFTQLVNKYYENFQRFGVEINFSLAFLFIIVQRIDLTKIIKRNKEKYESDSNNIRKSRDGQNEFSQTANKTDTVNENSNN